MSRLATALLSLVLFTMSAIFWFGGLFAQEVQQAKKIPRIGLLVPYSPTSDVSLSFQKAFHQGLQELGYVEGRNVAIEYRYAEGVGKRFPKLAEELVGLKVDIIVTTADPPSLAVKEATTTIPIVFTQAIDPMRAGLVASLARPGGNLTGLSQAVPGLSPKRLELLKEAFPKISRVAVLLWPDSKANVARFKETQVGGKAMDVRLQSLEMRTAEDFDGAFRAATTERADGLIVLQSALIITHRARIIELAAKGRLPTMFEESSHVEAGGLMSYGPSYFDLQRRAAGYVDRILKGANPADLPVEQPKKFDLVINLKTAKQIDMTITPEVLAKASQVIK